MLVLAAVKRETALDVKDFIQRAKSRREIPDRSMNQTITVVVGLINSQSEGYRQMCQTEFYF